MSKKIYPGKALSLILILVLWSCQANACTWIFWRNPLNCLTARTMDLTNDDHPTWVLLPRGLNRCGTSSGNALRWTSRYGSVVMSAFNWLGVSEGLNEKGLSAHVLYFENTNYPKQEHLPELSNGLWVQYLLDTCASVDQALKAMKNFQLTQPLIGHEVWPLHASLSDAGGDSAIIEFINGKIHIYHGLEHNVLTNEPPYDTHFLNFKQSIDGNESLVQFSKFSPEDRFIQSKIGLNALKPPYSAEQAYRSIQDLIQKVQVPFFFNALSAKSPSPTRWISIIDHTHLIYHFQSCTTENKIWIDIKEINFNEESPVFTIDPHNIKTSGKIRFN